MLLTKLGSFVQGKVVLAVRYNWRLKAYAVLGCARICNIYTTMAVAVDHITLYALLGLIASQGTVWASQLHGFSVLVLWREGADAPWPRVGFDAEVLRVKSLRYLSKSDGSE